MEVECDNCGETTDKRPAKVEENDHVFCSRECYYDFGRPDMQGENNPNPKKEKVGVECVQCGDIFEVYPYRKETASFCSRECKDKHQSTVTGEDAPNYRGQTKTFECQQCGGKFERYVRKNDCIYCSKECYQEASKEMFKGEANPVWRGGYDGYYGPNWKEQRQAALERDNYECQDCGDQSEGNHVHHKKRMGWFKEEYESPQWYLRANKLENLVTLCPSCHMQREWQDGQISED